MKQAKEDMLVGLALDASRVQAACGPAGRTPRPLPLAGVEAELPSAISMAGRKPVVGRAGVALCRQCPHLVCSDFLAHLGDTRTWKAGRHRLNAERALGLVLEQVRPACAGARGLVLVLPAYLSAEQIDLAAAVAGQVGARGRSPLPPVLASLTTPLAVALTAYADQGWFGPALVLDADDYALTWSRVTVVGGEARALDVHVLPHLGLRAWRERLINAVADRCVRQSRRDPRDSAAAEQALYEQLDPALEACRQGRPADLFVHLTGWYQNLTLRPEELASVCAPLARPAVDAMRGLLSVTASAAPPGAVLVTAAAGRLPGLTVLLEESLGDLAVIEEDNTAGDDFGITLFDENETLRSGVGVLAADAATRAAHALAGRWLRGDVPGGHLEAAPLPPPEPLDAGPGRLHFSS